MILSCARAEPHFDKTPVFFVHGYGMSAGHWKRMISYLTESGYPRQYMRAIQLVPKDGSNIHAAQNQISPAIDKFLEEINSFLKKRYPDIPPKTKIDLISHSMGSLSARWYAAKLRPEKVRVWLSLAGANHGTNALCGFSGQGAEDCCPAYAKNRTQSPIQHALNGNPNKGDADETPYGVGKDSPGVDSIPPDQQRRILYVTIRTSPDKWIEPDDSVILDGAGGVEIPIPGDLPAESTSPGNILMKNNVGHDPMLGDADTMRLVGIILKVNPAMSMGDFDSDNQRTILIWRPLLPIFG